MNTHTMLDGMILAVISLASFVLLMLLASYLERKALKKWKEENSITNFDIEN